MKKTAIESNKTPYKKRIVDALVLTRPVLIKSAESAFVENYPRGDDPGHYIVGVPDEISLGGFLCDGSKKKLQQ